MSFTPAVGHYFQNKCSSESYCCVLECQYQLLKVRTSWLPSKKETYTFDSKILKNLGLKKSGHLEIRGYLNFSQFFTLGQ